MDKYNIELLIFITRNMFLFSICYKNDECKSDIQLLREQISAQNKVDMWSIETKIKDMTVRLDRILEIIETDNNEKMVLK